MKDDCVKNFIDELQRVLELFPDYHFTPAPGAALGQIESLEKTIGLRFDGTLRSLWEFSDGSNRVPWFGVHSDEDTPCEFLGIKGALKLWKEWNALGEKWGPQGMPDSPKRDPRIQRGWNPKWFPFGELNGGSTMILFDSTPTPKGPFGQIIAYQHDPDAVYYIAAHTAAFLAQSPQILQRCLQELAAARRSLKNSG